VHWKAMKSVIRYLIGTTDHVIFFPFGQEATVEAWSDAYWARDHHKRRSRSGYLVTVAGCPVVCASRLQTLTAQSTTEAEFISLAHCVREVHWIRATLSELEAEQSNPTFVHQDKFSVQTVGQPRFKDYEKSNTLLFVTILCAMPLRKRLLKSRIFLLRKTRPTDLPKSWLHRLFSLSNLQCMSCRATIPLPIEEAC